MLIDKRPSSLSLGGRTISNDEPSDSLAIWSSSKVKRVLGRLLNRSSLIPPYTESLSPESVFLSGKHTDSARSAILVLPTRPTKRRIPSFLQSKKSMLSLKTSSGSAPDTQSNNAPITVLPPIDSSSYTRKDILYKGKGKPVSSSRDSKFSSISSLPSLQYVSPSVKSPTRSCATTIASAQITLNPQEFSHLQSLLRRATRRLQQQEHIVSNLANNLSHILGRKELSVRALKRVGKAEQQNMIQTIFRVKENCGRIFLRKSAFLQHSNAELEKLKAMAAQSAKEAVLAIPEACTSKRATDGIEYVVSREMAIDFARDMGRNGDVQRSMDKELSKCVLDRAREARWVVNTSERIMMTRFVGFLEKRGKVLEQCYGDFGKVVKEIEAALKDKKLCLL